MFKYEVWGPDIWSVDNVKLQRTFNTNKKAKAWIAVLYKDFVLSWRKTNAYADLDTLIRIDGKFFIKTVEWAPREVHTQSIYFKDLSKLTRNKILKKANPTDIVKMKCLGKSLGKSL